MHIVQSALHSRNPFLRKGSVALLRLPQWMARLRALGRHEGLSKPVLVNSFPKSGTHLLDQIVAAFPHRRNYGTFLASMTSSFVFRERTKLSTTRAIGRFATGELVRGHLFYDSDYVRTLQDRGVVHYFIHRDPRDVVVSEAHYLTSLNRWHRLHPHFRRQPNLRAAVRLSIRGLPENQTSLYYPDVGERFSRYAGWLSEDSTHCVRFEDLVSEKRSDTVREMVRFYASRTSNEVDIDRVADRCIGNIDPGRSHTYRKGTSGGWREHFDDELKEEFKQIAGDLLTELGYEKDLDW